MIDVHWDSACFDVLDGSADSIVMKSFSASLENVVMRISFSLEFEPINDPSESYPMVACFDLRSTRLLLDMFSHGTPNMYSYLAGENRLFFGLGGGVGCLWYIDNSTDTTMSMESEVPVVSQVVYFTHEGTKTPFWPINVLSAEVAVGILIDVIGSNCKLEQLQFKRKYWGSNE
jgi:hypothetical protein